MKVTTSFTRGSRPLRLPLAARILLICALSALPCFLFVLWSGKRLEASLEDRARAECTSMAVSFSTAGNLLLRSAAESLRGTALAPPLRDRNPRSAPTVLAPAVGGRGYFVGLSLLDPSGNEVVGAGQPRVSRPGSAFLAPPQDSLRIRPFADGDGRALLALTVPVPSRDGGPPGSLVGFLDLTRLMAGPGLPGLPQGAWVFGCDRAGDVLFSLSGDAERASALAIDPVLVGLLRAAPLAQARAVEDSEGRGLFAAGVPLDEDGDGETDLLIGAASSRAGLTAELRRIYAETTRGVGAVALLGIVLALVASRLLVVSRMRRLVARARGMGRAIPSEGRVRARLRDELHELALALDEFDLALEAWDDRLRDSTENLEGSLREKESLLREVHHRVYNNFQVVVSLLRLEGETVRGAEAQAVLRDSERRVLAMAQVHAQVYASGDFAKVDFAEYIRAILETQPPEDRDGRLLVPILEDLEAIRLDLSQAVPLGLILNELLVAAALGSLGGEATGTIVVGLAASGEGRAALTVVGGRAEGTGQPEALGLELVRGLTLQLRGDFSTDPTPYGVRSVVDIPLRRPQS